MSDFPPRCRSPVTKPVFEMEPSFKILRIGPYGMRRYIKLERGRTGDAAQDFAAQAGAPGNRHAQAAGYRPRSGRLYHRTGRLPDPQGGETTGDRLVPSRPPLHGR
jgi:hypothetical protein